MGRGWRRFLEESQDRRTDRLPRIERIRKEKRSVRGRVTDDWFIPSTPQNYLQNVSPSSPLRLGRVIEVHKRGVFIAEEDQTGAPDTGAIWLCSVAKRHFQRAHRERNFVVVGDVVLFVPDEGQPLDDHGEPLGDLPRGVVQHAFERWTKISRRDPMRPDWEHVLIANIDLLVVVASVLKPEVRWGLIDRFLVQAEMRRQAQPHGTKSMEVVVVLNKWDLLQQAGVQDSFRAQLEDRVQTLKRIGYDVYCVSALKPKSCADDLSAFKKKVARKLIGFCGHSGVGKSSLINLLGPEFDQVVDEDADIFYKGRHTTTYNSLLQISRGAYAIDTPGIRSFHFKESDPRILSATFPEFSKFSCQFSDCSHVKEEGCGIREAVAKGLISQHRYRSYLGILTGESPREGDGNADDADMRADLEARRLYREP